MVDFFAGFAIGLGLGAVFTCIGVLYLQKEKEKKDPEEPWAV